VELSAGAIGAGLILIGLAFLVVESITPGWGGPGALGIVSVAAGVLFVLDSSNVLELPPGVVIVLCALAAIFVPTATVLTLRLRKVPVFVPPSLVGTSGIATSDLDPRGTVRVRAEEFSAESADGSTIGTGTKVRVVDEAGLQLRVEPE
jgi:membrane-bound serine protease (ClpP class)